MPREAHLQPNWLWHGGSDQKQPRSSWQGSLQGLDLRHTRPVITSAHAPAHAPAHAASAAALYHLVDIECMLMQQSGASQQASYGRRIMDRMSSDSTCSAKAAASASSTSASSSTAVWQALRSRVPACRCSHRRPGVPTTRSTPCCSAFLCVLKMCPPAHRHGQKS